MGGERMKKVCLTVLCILLVGCGNAETAETEEKMRFENLDPAKVNMQYGGLKEWDRFYNSFYEQKEGSDLIVLGTVEDYSCFAGGIEIATDISLRVDDVLKGDMEAGEHITVRKPGGAVTVEVSAVHGGCGNYVLERRGAESGVFGGGTAGELYTDQLLRP